MQTATGLQGGAEAAIHSMSKIFENNNTEAVILVDASNAFNSMNRQVALHNIRVICPEFSNTLINTYRNPVRMVVLGGRDIFSVEGTTQGDNLAMAFYALGTSPLLKTLSMTSPSVSQVSLADDITGAGKLEDLKVWWDSLTGEGAKFGYYVNESKSWLIVKDEQQMNRAKEIFKGSDIKFTSQGKRHLGASIGSHNFKTQYVTEKVQTWCREVEKLAEYAKTEPHAA